MAAKDGKSDEKKIPKYMNFVMGGAAGMTGTLFVQPMDLLKNRMQLSVSKSATTLEVIKGVIKNEGILAFYNGLSAGLARQATYTTTRLGVYTWLFETLSKDGKPPNFAIKTTIGMLAGVVGSFVGNPCEVALIRMTADGKLPASERRNYKNVFDAIFRVVREEGVLTLWRGATATMGRAMVVNAAQLATYSQSKEFFVTTFQMREGIGLHFCAAMVSGLVTTIASMPVDIAKTRLQNMKSNEYKGTMDVFVKIMKNEGVLALWKGFLPYYARLGPHTVLTFTFLELYTKLYNRHVLGKDV